MSPGVIATETLVWKDPELLPPPDTTPRGVVLIGWIFCHVGMEFWSSLVRRDGQWCLLDSTGADPVPSHTRVVAYADPPRGPGSGIRQHGKAS